VKLEIEIDREICIGAENCVRYAPNTFVTDDRGKASLRGEPWDSDEIMRIAVSSCPVSALSIRSGTLGEGE